MWRYTSFQVWIALRPDWEGCKFCTDPAKRQSYDHGLYTWHSGSVPVSIEVSFCKVLCVSLTFLADRQGFVVLSAHALPIA